MEPTIFQYIWRHSKRQQIVVLLMTLASFPILYLSLEVPKLIINEALSDATDRYSLLGLELEQIPFLITLCVVFLALVLFNGVLKMRISIYKGVIAERMIRRLRYQLLERILRFPRSHFRRVSPGEIIPMVTAEVEPLGGLMGDAVGQPVFQAGQMLTILIFLFVQNVWLGLSAVALVPLQAYVIPKLQRQVNLLHKERVRRIRKLSERIGETVSGVQDIHVAGTSAYTRAEFTDQLGAIFHIRFEVYRKKFMMKFVNNMMNNMTPFLFYSVGGILVIQGNLSLGALVAALSAYKDLTSPWKELLAYYNQMMDSTIRYDAIIEQFAPPGLMDEKLQHDYPEHLPHLDGNIEVTNVSWSDEDGVRVVRNVTATIEAGTITAIVGPDDVGRERLAQLLGRTLQPTSGQISIDGLALERLSEAITGARIAYVGPDSYIFSGTIGDNIRLSLKRSPPKDFEKTPSRDSELKEAMASGNSEHPFDVDWIDYKDAGFPDAEAFKDWWLALIRTIHAEDYLFERAMDVVIDPERDPPLTKRLLAARAALDPVIMQAETDGLVRRFHRGTYNPYASVAENIVFGVATDDRLSLANIGAHPYVRHVLDACGLTARFQQVGLLAARAMLDMFTDVAPGHPFFERYAFIDAELLPELHNIELRAQAGLDKLDDEELAMLTNAPFLLVVERHRLGLVDEDMQTALVEARHYFYDNLPADLSDAIVAFDSDDYLPHTSLTTNLLRGRIAYSQGSAEQRVRKILMDKLTELGLRRDIILLVGETETGMAGSRLPRPARERLALVRGLAKRPDVLVLNQVLTSFSEDERIAVLGNVRRLLPDATIMWLDKRVSDQSLFDQVLEIKEGRLQPLGLDADVEDESQEAPPDELQTEIAQLAKVPLLAGLPANQLKLVAFSSERLNYTAGDIIFSQGEPADFTYVVLAGSVELTQSSAGGTVSMGTFSVGTTLGEIAAVCDVASIATARAARDSVLLRMSKQSMLDLIQQNPHIAESVLRYVGEKVLRLIDSPQVT